MIGICTSENTISTPRQIIMSSPLAPLEQHSTLSKPIFSSNFSMSLHTVFVSSTTMAVSFFALMAASN